MAVFERGGAFGGGPDVCEDEVGSIVGGKLREADVVPCGDGICVYEGRSAQLGGIVAKAPAISIIYASACVLQQDVSFDPTCANERRSKLAVAVVRRNSNTMFARGA